MVVDDGSASIVSDRLRAFVDAETRSREKGPRISLETGIPRPTSRALSRPSAIPPRDIDGAATGRAPVVSGISSSRRLAPA
jgi:hypothetical protein